MAELIVSVALGMVISILGIINMTGNISSLHWYHRQRVTEPDRKPFGRLVGAGNLIIGLSLAVFGVLSFVAEQTRSDVFLLIGTVLLILGIVVGLALSFFAMIKYNKGIF